MIYGIWCAPGQRVEIDGSRCEWGPENDSIYVLIKVTTISLFGKLWILTLH